MSTRISKEVPTTTPARRIGRKRLFTSIAALTAACGALTVGALNANAGGGVSIGSGVTTVGDSADAGDDSGDDYANVMNPFGGPNLLRDDDLILTLGNETPQYPGMQENWVSGFSTSNSAGTQCIYGNPLCNMDFYEYDFEQPPVAGRFFNTVADTVVQTPSTFNDQVFNIEEFQGSDGGYQPQAVTQDLPYGTNSTTTSLSAVADFNSDGYDDLLEIYSDYANQFTGNGRARILTALGHADQPSQGLAVGPESSLGFPYGARSVAVGDFDGDGKPEVAVLFIDSNNCPNLSIYTVDSSLNLNLAQTIMYGDPVDNGSVNAPMQLVAGTFIPGNSQQLVLAVQPSATSKMKLRLFTFPHADSPLTPFEAGNVVTNQVSKVKLAVGRFDWTSQVDSLAVMLTNVDNGNSTSAIDIVNIVPDPNSSALNPTIIGTVNVAKDLFDSNDHNYVALDIATGNFDNQAYTTPVADGGATQQLRNPNMQVAIATGYCKGTNVQQSQFQTKNLYVYDVNPAATGSAVMTKQSSQPITLPLGLNNSLVTRMALSAADLHGRSLRLGPGVRIAQDKTSPTMMLAQPPSHIDYLMNADGTFSLQNQTFSTAGFFAQYVKTGTTSTSYNQSYSHGWSMASEESVSGSIRLGTKGDNGTFSVSDTAMQDWNKRTDNTYGSQSTTSESLSFKTGTTDEMVYDDTTTYLYAYEVVGKTVCPEGQTTCDDSAKVPEVVEFSATGSAQTYIAPDDALPWYQPVWENGNVLSYPGNQAQLMYDVSNPVVTNTPNSFTMGGGATSSSTTWTGTQNETNTVDWTKNWSENSADSIGFTDTTAAYQGKITVGIDLTRSDSTDSLKSQSASITEATTIGLTAQSAGISNHYQITPFVYGENAPPNYFDPNDPDHAWATPIQSNGINVFGPMRTAFTVDPLPSNGDSETAAFWNNNYRPSGDNGGAGAFDIALNHPFRWRDHSGGAPDGLLPSNCVNAGGIGYVDCVSEKPRMPGDPAADWFHSMRGFFIYRTSDANTATPANQGLQVETATTGDALTLEARVYNYSLNPMPPGTKVRVQFYGMPWSASGWPADHTQTVTGGASFKIGEWNTTAIQPFNTDSPTPNFVMASVPFDTSSYTGTFAFWVIVWAEDANGNMIQELPGKGLTASPTSATLDGGTRTTFTDFTDLEPTVPNAWQLSANEPDTTSFSNNIGFFPGQLTILPPSVGATIGAHATGDVHTLSVASIRLPRTRVQQGEMVDVSATVHNGGDPTQHTTVYFYDGDPTRGGTIFAARRLPYVDSTADRTERVQLTASTCGTHDVYVQITHAGQAAPTAKAIQSINVVCDGSSGTGGGSDDAGAGNGVAPTGGDGGCSCNVGPDQPDADSGLLFPFAAAIASFWARRKRK